MPDFFPTPEQLLNAPVSVLLHSSVLPRFDQAGVALAVRERSPFIYPEGTLEFSLANDAEVAPLFNRNLRSVESFPSGLLYQQYWIRNLLGFPLRKYLLLYHPDYGDRQSEDGLRLGPGWLTFYPGERSREDLLFSIRMRRKASRKVAAGLVSCLSIFFRSVSAGGIDSEGPLLVKSPQVIWCGRRFDLHLDATRTGPRTLMWLLLVAFKFGFEVAPVEDIVFNDDDEVRIHEELELGRRGCAFAEIPWTDGDIQRHLDVRRGGAVEDTVLIPLFL
jgi:hypothetical protein